MNTHTTFKGKRHFIWTTPEFQRYRNGTKYNLTKDEEREELNWWNIKQTSVRTGNVYIFWFEFLKRNEDYKKVCMSKGKIGTTELKKLYLDFGNIHDKSFRQWWRENDKGANLFAEQTPEHKIQEITDKDELHFTDNILNIQIPLSFSQRDIARLVSELVKKKHIGKRGKRKNEKTSSALYKVAGRIDLKSLERTLAVYDLIEKQRLKDKKDRKSYYQIATELREKGIHIFKDNDAYISKQEELKRKEVKDKERLDSKRRKDAFLKMRKSSEHSINIKDYDKSVTSQSNRESHPDNFDDKRNKIDATISRFYKHAKKLIKNASSHNFPNMR